jgi:small subunit ribosomal protein S5
MLSALKQKHTIKLRKNMVQVNLKGKTITHPIFYKKAAAKIMLRPAAPGTGVIAGSALRAVLEVVGVGDILTKVIGSNNSIIMHMPVSSFTIIKTVN